MRERPLDHIIIAGSSFLVYLIYLCPNAFNGDSPMLATSAFAMGPAHPPGYPLYAVLGKFFTMIPSGSIAYKANLLSAISGAICVYLVWEIVHLVTDNRTSALFASLLSLFAPLAFSESTKAEVYTLGSALSLLILFICVRHAKGISRQGEIYVSWFVLGLGMGNHHTIAFMGLPMLAAMLIGRKEGIMKTSALSLCFFLAGFSVNFFVYARSIKYFNEEALFAYSDAHTLGEFIDTFLRTAYGSSSIEIASSAAQKPSGFWNGAYNSIVHLGYANLGLPFLFSALSLIILKDDRKTSLVLAAAFVSFGVMLSSLVFSFVSPRDIDLFTKPPYMLPLLYIFAALTGIGAHYALGYIRRFSPFALRPISVGLVALPMVFIAPNALKTSDYSEYYLADDFPDDSLEAMPPLSSFIAGGDSSYFPFIYKIKSERKSDDVVLLLFYEDRVTSQINPRWKYAEMFPGLGTGRIFDREGGNYAESGKVFTFDVKTIDDSFFKGIDIFPYVHSFVLFPANLHKEDKAEEMFRAAFPRIVYERILNDRNYDPLSLEMKTYYFMALNHYAYLVKKDGKDYAPYYEKALKIIAPRALYYYLEYLQMIKNEDEIRSFVIYIKPLADKYPEVKDLRKQLIFQFLADQDPSP